MKKIIVLFGAIALIAPNSGQTQETHEAVGTIVRMCENYRVNSDPSIFDGFGSDSAEMLHNMCIIYSAGHERGLAAMRYTEEERIELQARCARFSGAGSTTPPYPDDQIKNLKYLYYCDGFLHGRSDGLRTAAALR